MGLLLTLYLDFFLITFASTCDGAHLHEIKVHQVYQGIDKNDELSEEFHTSKVFEKSPIIYTITAINIKTLL